MKGTHLPKTKKRLSDIEKELLSSLLDSSIEWKTAKEVSRIMNWDIRQTTSTLSNLVGMDLCIETDVNTKITDEITHKFSSGEPLYGIPLDTIYRERAIYADSRGWGEEGPTLWKIINGELGGKEFHLWPFRPVDRVKTGGRVFRDDDDRVNISITIPKELAKMVGQDVDITIKTRLK